MAAYRFPYLLAGGSLVFKQDSIYYEHFYNELIPNTHYIPLKRDLSDLIDKLNWALKNDEEAKKIAKQGSSFANKNLLPQHILCYYAHLINEFSKNIISEIQVFADMEKLEQVTQQKYCDCNQLFKDEL